MGPGAVRCRAMTNDSGIPIAAIAAAAVLGACSSAQPRSGGSEGDLYALADRYFDEVMFKYGPTEATRAGLHQHDARLEDPSRSAIDAQVAALRDFEQRFESVQAAPGSTEAADRQLLLSAVRANLLDLTTV